MHTYAVDQNRGSISGALITIAIVTTFLFSWTIQKLHIYIPIYIDTPAVAGFYEIMNIIYNNVIWRLKIGSSTLSKIPDIRGTWVGPIKYTYKGKSSEKLVVVSIKQTWSDFSLDTATLDIHIALNRNIIKAHLMNYMVLVIWIYLIEATGVKNSEANTIQAHTIKI